MSRFSSGALLASSSSTDTVTTATSPVLSIASSIGMRILSDGSKLYQGNAVAAQFIALIQHLVHTARLDIGSESDVSRAVWHPGRLARNERTAQVRQAHGHGIGTDLGLYANPLIGTAPIRVPHDVAGRLTDRELQRVHERFRGDRIDPFGAEAPHEFAHSVQLARVAPDIDRVPLLRRWLSNAQADAGQIVR